MSLIAFHELGHYLTGKIFNWKIDKIYIFPLGGVTKFNDKINKPFIEELLVTIMGPLFQIMLAYYLISVDHDVEIYNRLLLTFNLLPIVPLDGSKLLSLIFEKIMPYKKRLKITIIISYILYFLLIVYVLIISNSYFYKIVVLFLIFKINEELNKTSYYFNKFLLERSIYNFKFKKNIIINDIKDMYKYKNNIFKIDNKLYYEKEMIKIFHKKM